MHFLCCLKHLKHDGNWSHLRCFSFGFVDVSVCSKAHIKFGGFLFSLLFPGLSESILVFYQEDVHPNVRLSDFPPLCRTPIFCRLLSVPQCIESLGNSELHHILIQFLLLDRSLNDRGRGKHI